MAAKVSANAGVLVKCSLKTIRIEYKSAIIYYYLFILIQETCDKQKRL